MRIQTRLFLGTATLVLALMALQWWLYARQLKAIEADLTHVATSVGKEILSGDFNAFFQGLPFPKDHDGQVAWVAASADHNEMLDGSSEPADPKRLPLMVVGEASEVEVKRIIEKRPDTGNVLQGAGQGFREALLNHADRFRFT